ncbi:hypothetical protein J2045_004621 [Peteryoungia aggregata LMG 23059]|uniref:Uncharacterized protein n=1 Tax=Peteryoungia aggregata LMG 23059 TaxID=1368425 RepID=A0ABU0GDX8_9HYPH|nr:hypothetical protein [Peteryoungia aggregata]MDQ0423569.1 hypothetical protein [Peteryoungia aggregata LMG 23059]
MAGLYQTLQTVGSDFGQVSIGADHVHVQAIGGTDAFVSPDRQTAIDSLPGARLALRDPPRFSRDGCARMRS